MKRSALILTSTILSLISSASIAFSATHTVQHGDTLWGISAMHKVSVESIQQANNLSGSTIQLGQVLIIPSHTDTKSSSVAPTPAKAVIVTELQESAKPTIRTHIVKKGENLWRIAKNHNTTMEELMRLNHLSSSVITVGQVITLSGEPEPPKNKETVTKEKVAPQIQTQLPVAQELSVSPVKVKEKTETREQQEVALDPLAPLPPAVPSQPVTSEVEEISQESQKANAVEVPEPTQPSQLKGLVALSEKQRGIVCQQILLDRHGMGPGVIDGYEGSFSKGAAALAQTYRAELIHDETPLIKETRVPAAILHYINPDLPGSGKRPDFKQATEDQCLMMYKTVVELLAERYHCSEKLLAKMNPQVDFAKVKVGEKIWVPNVTEFKIEQFMDSGGNAITYKYLRSSRRATRVDVDYLQKRIMVWYNSGNEGDVDELLASFPVTTNIKKGPKTQRTIAYFAPAPNYMRKKTGLKLKPGPNSPVGIVWAKLGDGYGIHGTSDGSGNGYNTSSGCIRLSNWDMAVFVQIVPSKTVVNFITGPKIAKKSQPASEAGGVSMVKH